MKSIYTYYKERLIEISGKNRSLYLKNFSKKNGYDVGKLLYQNQELANELVDNLWNGRAVSFELISKERKQVFEKNIKIDESLSDANDLEGKKKLEKQKNSFFLFTNANECSIIETLHREVNVNY